MLNQVQLIGFTGADAEIRSTQGGKQVASPKSYGNRKHKAIEPAPGAYVKSKA